MSGLKDKFHRTIDYMRISITDFAKMTMTSSYQIRFIEFMPFGKHNLELWLSEFQAIFIRTIIILFDPAYRGRMRRQENISIYR